MSGTAQKLLCFQLSWPFQEEAELFSFPEAFLPASPARSQSGFFHCQQRRWNNSCHLQQGRTGESDSVHHPSKAEEIRAWTIPSPTGVSGQDTFILASRSSSLLPRTFRGWQSSSSRKALGITYPGDERAKSCLGSQPGGMHFGKRTQVFLGKHFWMSAKISVPVEQCAFKGCKGNPTDLDTLRQRQPQTTLITAPKLADTTHTGCVPTSQQLGSHENFLLQIEL